MRSAQPVLICGDFGNVSVTCHVQVWYGLLDSNLSWIWGVFSGFGSTWPTPLSSFSIYIAFVKLCTHDSISTGGDIDILFNILWVENMPIYKLQGIGQVVMTTVIPSSIARDFGVDSLVLHSLGIEGWVHLCYYVETTWVLPYFSLIVFLIVSRNNQPPTNPLISTLAYG